MSISRTRNGRKRRQQQLVSLNEVTEEALVLLHDKIKTLRLHKDLVTQVLVYGKRSELIRLTMNLISNAADAIRDLEAQDLKVAIHLQNKKVILLVEDSGPGIPEKLQTHIFRPFYTTKPSGKGTGLGLAVVQTVLKHHRGEVRVDRSPDLGVARFTVEMPAA